MHSTEYAYRGAGVLTCPAYGVPSNEGHKPSSALDLWWYPFTLMTLSTLNQIFFSIVDRDQPCVMKHQVSEKWIEISSLDFYREVAGVSRALREWGIAKGDRVAILSENRPEWTMADFACLLIGAVVVPIYATLTEEQTAYILRDAGVRAVFVSSQKQLQKILDKRDSTSIERIVVMDDLESDGVVAMSQLRKNGPSQRDASFDKLALSIATPNDLATIIYTSGTTGTPKGVMLTHGNIAANIEYSLRGFDIGPADTSISFLPLSHITARHLDLALLYRGVTLAYVSFIEQLSKALLEIRPTFVVAVPRVYEKVYAKVDLGAKTFTKNLLYRWAISTGRSHRAEILAGRRPTSLSWKLLNRLLYTRILAGFGGNARFFISGGAPLGRELAEWYADMGIRIHEGYGLTETSPVIALNNPTAHKIGTIGKPLANVEVRIAEDGEILVRGPSVFQGYWNLPEETRNAFVDGWFKTGDIGNMDADGFLSITDRKKDLIKTSGGKFIAPQPIENSLKHSPLVAEAVVLGDKRKFPAVLIAPAFTVLESWARTRQISFTSRQQLVADPAVRTLYEKIVEDVNQNLARFEKLKKVLLVPDEFSAENETLTASMKIRRRAVEKRYAKEIEGMYSGAEASGAAPQPD
jgi:long-chain acyl-CoA synthetase